MLPAPSRIDDSPAWQSLKWRLPVLICGLFVVVLLGVAFAAYREVEATLERSAGDRAQKAASQIAGMFAPGTVQTRVQMQNLAPRLRPHLDKPTPESLSAVRAVLATLAPTPQRRLTLWSASGARVLDIPDQTAVAPSLRPPPDGIGQIQAEGDRAFVDVAVAVPGGGGLLSVRSVLAISPADGLTKLIGGDARILFGNQVGEVWTDMTHIVPGPAVDRAVTTFQRYQLAPGDERLGSFGVLPGTPWLVWVEFPKATVLAGATAFLEKMAITVFLVAIGAVLLVRRLVVSVTAPLAEMTTAAEAFAAGDYSRLVKADRTDEIGRLGRAFNAMSGDIARELTQRTQAHEQLEEREAQLRLYALHSPVAVAMFDRDMRYLIASDRWIQDYRLGGQPLIGRSHYEVFPDLPQRWLDIHQRCLAGAVERCDEDPFTRAPGDTSWIRWEVRPWRQADGVVGGLIIFAEDITTRKTAEAELRASEGRYRTLFDQAPDGILIADSQSRYLDANASMCRMLGYSRAEIMGRDATDIVVPSEVEHIEPALATIGAHAEYHREWKFRRRDGSVFDADVIATQMPDGNILGMVRDTTDRNQATEALRLAEERMRFALESANVGIWDADYRTGAVRWSAILEAQYGLAAGTFPGTLESFLSALHPDDRASAQATIEAAIQSGHDFRLQHRIVRPDGTVRWMEGAGSVQLGPGGEPVRGVGISLDVTGRHNLEAQFQQAQKMEAIGRLAGGVAHDFNNLLTAILGYCELLLEDSDADSHGRLEITEIQNAGIRAAGLTRQLLAFSRKEIIEPKLLDLNDVVSGVHPLLQRLIDESISTVITLDSQPMPITADLGQIEQVIVNLAVNARDAMPRGGTLTVSTANVELDDDYAAAHFNVKPGHYVSLTVTDTGIGMSADVQGHLFEPFFTTKAQGKGTGLGLATVHGVVTGCGGSVGVYSEVGRGTSFVVYLPRATALAAPAAVPKVEPSTPVRGRTVLAVEDADGLRDLIRRILQRQGHTVIVASNATEAMQRFDENPNVELLLTDVIMPGASGPELTIDLLKRRPSLKVIYMSGYTEDTVVRHGVLVQGINFLHKPFTARALGQKIHEVLGA